jgi:hypothetical protein
MSSLYEQDGPAVPALQVNASSLCEHLRATSKTTAIVMATQTSTTLLAITPIFTALSGMGVLNTQFI